MYDLADWVHCGQLKMKRAQPGYVVFFGTVLYECLIILLIWLMVIGVFLEVILTFYL